MDKTLYITPTVRVVRVKAPQLLVSSIDKDPTEDKIITDGDDIGAKGTSFGLWGDDEEAEE